MKRILLYITFCLLTMPALGQVKFGVTGGISVSKVRFDKSVYEARNRTGFYLGPTLEFMTPGGLGFDVSILYDNKGVKVTDETNGTSSSTLQYLDIPINLKLSAGVGKLVRVYLSTGPQFACNMGNTNILKGNYKLQDSAFSWNFGAAVRVLSNYQIGYTYNLGVGKTAELSATSILDDAKNGNLKNFTHQISVSYFF